MTNCRGPLPNYLHFNTGVNYSKLNGSQLKNIDFNQRYQVSFTYEVYFGDQYVDPINSFEYGLSYNQNGFKHENANGKVETINYEYLSIPITYNYIVYNTFPKREQNRFFDHILLLRGGAYLSYLMNSNVDNNKNSIPTLDYGIKFGPRIEFLPFSYFFCTLEYNLFLGLGDFSGDFEKSNNISHSIELGVGMYFRFFYY